MKKYFTRIFELSYLFNSISIKRKVQFFQLTIISIVSAFIEIFNISIIIPYLASMAQIQSYETASNLSLIKKFIPAGNSMLIISLLMILFILISMLFRMITLYIQFKLSTSIASDLGLEVFNKSLEMPYKWHLEINSSILKGYLTKDVDNVSEYIKGVTFILVNSILVTFISSYLIFIYPIRTITLIAIIFLIYFLLFFILKYSLVNDGNIYSKKYQETLKIAEETYNNIDLIKISNNFKYFKRKFSRPNKDFRNMSANINIKSQAPKYIIESFLLVFIISLSLFIYFINDDFESQFIFLGTIGLGTLKLLTPLQQLFFGFTSIQAYKASYKKVLNLLNENNQYFESSNKFFEMEKNVILEFINVSFKYKSKDKYSVKEINLKIKEGEKIGIVGFSGSGKSTFAKLLTGLLKPVEGVIIKDNRNLFESKKNLFNWYKNIAYIPQNVFLNDDDILNNIAYATNIKDINIDQVRKLSRISEIDKFIDNLPKKYFTKVGEKGSKLSTGQKQRIGISRGLYKNPKIIVFDEALNSLDINNEIKILNNIFENYRKETIILISHRLTSLIKCDRIIIFNNGSIEEIGTYSDLKNRSNIFKKLLSLET